MPWYLLPRLLQCLLNCFLSLKALPHLGHTAIFLLGKRGFGNAPLLLKNPSGSPLSAKISYSLASKPSMSDFSLVESQLILLLFQLDWINCAENIICTLTFILRDSHHHHSLIPTEIFYYYYLNANLSFPSGW